MLVCLTARPDVILERTARSKKRPLLAVADPGAKIRELLAARAPHYAQVPHQLDTSDADVDALAERLLDLWARG